MAEHTHYCTRMWCKHTLTNLRNWAINADRLLILYCLMFGQCMQTRNHRNGRSSSKAFLVFCLSNRYIYNSPWHVHEEICTYNRKQHAYIIVLCFRIWLITEKHIGEHAQHTADTHTHITPSVLVNWSKAWLGKHLNLITIHTYTLCIHSHSTTTTKCAHIYTFGLTIVLKPWNGNRKLYTHSVNVSDACFRISKSFDVMIYEIDDLMRY